MTWLSVLAVAAAICLFAALVLRVPRSSWALLCATLLFGLAGYALQANPDLASAPKASHATVDAESGEILVTARRGLFPPADAVPGYLTVSDGFARRGRFQQAAELLHQGLIENPRHGEGWLALALALTEHANGQVTPPAMEAFQRADRTLAGHPGPAYFLGTALLRSGRPLEAREVWMELLSSSPEDSPWIPDLRFRIAQLDLLMEQIRAQEQN